MLNLRNILSLFLNKLKNFDENSGSTFGTKLYNFARDSRDIYLELTNFNLDKIAMRDGLQKIHSKHSIFTIKMRFQMSSKCFAFWQFSLRHEWSFFFNLTSSQNILFRQCLKVTQTVLTSLSKGSLVRKNNFLFLLTLWPNMANKNINSFLG